jgi:hypothetical protein
MPIPFLSRSTSDLVFHTIANRPGLRAKEIFDEVKAQGSNVTYQNVHKILQQGIYNKILQKQNQCYFISNEWVQEMKKLADSLR